MKSLLRKTIAFKEDELFARGSEGRSGVDVSMDSLPEPDLTKIVSDEIIREPIEGFPELSEPEVIRHFTRLSQWNYGVDHNLYPLGSCTMKHNPRINEAAVRLDGFTGLHPCQPAKSAQGTLELLYGLGTWLAEISGLPAVSLQPCAGAQGEFAGLAAIKSAIKKKGENRTKILLPDSSHGTNPASAVLAGFSTEPLKSGTDGKIDLAELKQKMDDDVAGMMVTNPNTLGIFESNIIEAAEIIHTGGGYLYCDGANLNALMGKARFGDFGVDVCHINLHKTFATPHGGGGPGAGPICVTEELAPFLPSPVIVQKEDGSYDLDYDRPESVGSFHAFYGNVGVLVRAATYILSMGGEGLTRATEAAVLNANYIKARLKDYYDLPYDGDSLHEVVLSDKIQNETGITTLDIAKGLIDRGFHPPTIYFPLIVRGAIMIEPTETESLESLDQFCSAMIDISQKAKEDPDSLHCAPVNATTTRLDEALAARNPQLRCSLCG